MYNLDHETWLPKLHKRTDYMYFTSFSADKPFRAQYYEGKAKDNGQRQPKNNKLIDDILCIMGPCFFMHKARFFEQGGCDENHEGGWGNQGIEVSLKAWLSGGSLKVNKKTWFAHWFRGGGGPGFPYPISGRQIERVRKYSQDLWLNNKWDKQVRPLSWLIEKFSPVPTWTDADIAKTRTIISLPNTQTNPTTPIPPTVSMSKKMSSDAMGLPGVNGRGAITSQNIVPLGNESKMRGVATSSVITNMVELGVSTTNGKGSNKPSISKPMNQDAFADLMSTTISKSPITDIVQIPSPVPAPSYSIDCDPGKETSKIFNAGISGDINHVQMIPQPMREVKLNEMVSIIIPSRKERFINETIRDVLANAVGEVEVFPVLDGYDTTARVNDPRVKYICIPDNGGMQKRQAVNTAVSLARGKYVMCLDAHCMVGKGFDEILKKDCEENWIVIPRRYKLDPINWKIREDTPPIDYEYWMFREYRHGVLKPYRWERPERKDIMIDDTLTCQGSCWFMHKSYFERMGFMKCQGYTGWGQEDVELVMEAWTTGGRVVVNKNTWYAHLFKGKTFGRMYQSSNSQIAASRKYAYDYWCVQRKDDFMKVLKKFGQIPNWTL
jgi:glycosyltransferase involved in cell wall biosynthesis